MINHSATMIRTKRTKRTKTSTNNASINPRRFASSVLESRQPTKTHSDRPNMFRILDFICVRFEGCSLKQERQQQSLFTKWKCYQTIQSCFIMFENNSLGSPRLPLIEGSECDTQSIHIHTHTRH